jgi:tetratricopeptide (TPR) repeat protein
LRSNFRYADAYNNLGLVLLQQGKVDEAIASHLKGLTVRDDKASDHNNLCSAYLAKEDLDAKNGDTAKAAEDHDNALKQSDLALRCDPNFVGAWVVRAQISSKDKDFEKAAECLKAVVRIAPNSPDAIKFRFQIGLLYYELKRFDDAIDWYTQVIDATSSTPQPHVLFARGRAYEDKGDFSKAEKDFAAVLKIAPNVSEARDHLSLVRAKLGK